MVGRALFRKVAILMRYKRFTYVQKKLIILYGFYYLPNLRKLRFEGLLYKGFRQTRKVKVFWLVAKNVERFPETTKMF